MNKLRFAIMAITFSWAACGTVENIESDADVPDSRVPDSAVLLPDAASECVAECVSASELRDCEGGGQVISCPLGCDDTDEPRCRTVVPSNGLDVSHVYDVSAGLVVPAGQTAVVNTDSGAITGISSPRGAGTGIGNGIRFQFLDNGLSVFGVQDMDIQGTVRATGSRPLVILSIGPAEVRGTINVSAGSSGGHSNRSQGGVGGGNGAYGSMPATGCAPGANGVNPNANGYYSGGGGGGLGAGGAAGGSSSDVDEPGGAGGEISSCPGATLVPLRGGSGGGPSAYSTSTLYPGGGGGGAVQVTSYAAIRIDGGTIAAAGAGGSYYGRGGGSGGAILLEAPAISLSNAKLVANGGGGGGSYGNNGADGRLDQQPASGGSGGGGAGGSLLAGARPGTTSSGDGGGGGGAVGIIRLNVPFTRLSMVDSLSSPAELRGDPAAE